MVIDRRFEHNQKQRYYRVMLSQDLFGDWIVTRIWGSIGKASGKITHALYASHEEAALFIRRISKMKAQQGYQLCESV